ncbi:hypothetical protein AVEN_167322-1 [Araneus ventricosus]|uniref:Uncharacterized protein n=1 Tax=Araneus ventricosus TaxID=182803 RepID=A0A4Y2DBZ6_ARAVE|nr:hypothetical protein AVEN_167322-1 [Araneus ventricosus]
MPFRPKPQITRTSVCPVRPYERKPTHTQRNVLSYERPHLIIRTHDDHACNAPRMSENTDKPYLVRYSLRIYVQDSYCDVCPNSTLIKDCVCAPMCSHFQISSGQ